MTDQSLFLGFAPATGGDAVGQCEHFKGLMWNEIGRNHEGAYLRTICDELNRKRGVSVEYDPEVKGAHEWAKQAQEQAPRVWDQVAHGRKPECRILERRSCVGLER